MAQTKRQTSKPDQPLLWMPEPPEYEMEGAIWTSEAQTGVALAAIQRSRRAWLDGRPLVRFSSTIAGRQALLPSVPNHTLTELGTATLTVGPLSFPSTRLFEAVFDAPKPGELEPAPVPAPAPAPPAPAPAPAANGAPRPPSAELIAELGNRARTDAQLADVLKNAAEGKATPAQLAQLSRFINALQNELDASARVAAASAPPPKSAPRPSVPAKPRPPGLIIEFTENPTERYTLPPVFSVAASASTALITFACAAPSSGPSVSRSGASFGSFNAVSGPVALVTLRLEELSSASMTLPTLDKVARGCEQAKVNAMFSKPVESTDRYLVYRNRDLQAETRARQAAAGKLPRPPELKKDGAPRKPKAPGKYKRKLGVKPRIQTPQFPSKPSAKDDTPEDTVDVKEQIVDGVQRVYTTKRRALPADETATPTPEPV